MAEREPLGLVERIELIVGAVDAVCGHTDDPDIAAMRAVTFCLALNFHLAHEVDQTERARDYVSQVRDISGCNGDELTGAIALFSIRGQDILQEEITRIQRERGRQAEQIGELTEQVEDLQDKIKELMGEDG